MNKIVKIILGIVVVVVVVGLIWYGVSQTKKTSGPAAGEPIKIGWIGSLTGDVANLGENARAATEIAVAEVNAAGGINGRPLELIYEDGKCSGKESINAANKLMNIDNVNVILGGLCSGETAGFVKTAMEQKRIVFSYCSSNPALSNSGQYFFRDYPSDNFQGGYAANYIYNDLGKRKVAVIFVQNDWGVGIKDVFVKKFKDLGGQILAEEPVNQGDKDLKTQLTKIKESNPELIYFLGLTEETIAGLRQARELDMDMPFFGGDPWDDTRIWESLGKIADGAMYTIPYAPLNEHFKKAMQEKLNNDAVLMCTPGAYDAVKILAIAMDKVGTEPDKIQNELHNMKPYTKGVSSQSISFDQNGDIKEASYMVKIIKDGKAVEYKK
jgi:branched-chain amino acid transport system substrate-binding protein